MNYTFIIGEPCLQGSGEGKLLADVEVVSFELYKLVILLFNKVTQSALHYLFDSDFENYTSPPSDLCRSSIPH